MKTIQKSLRGLSAWIVLFLTVILIAGCQRAQEGRILSEDGSSAQRPSENISSGGADTGKADNANADTLFTVSFIDVGKGDCILLRSAAHTVLVDTGYEETAGRVLNYLAKQGVEQIDELIVTHFDKDHVGGAPALLENVAVGKVYLPDYEGESRKYDKLVKSLTEQHVDTERLREDITYTADGVTYQLFVSGVAYDPEKENDNDQSLVLLATYAEDAWLFAGDLEKKGIKEFLERHGDVQCAVLKLPHHGEKSGNTDNLLDSLQPEIAVITDGLERPAEEDTWTLLEERGIVGYSTMQNGTIEIRGDGQGNYRVTTAKS